MQYDNLIIAYFRLVSTSIASIDIL